MMMWLLAWIGMGCWIVCFIWMHRISSRQNAMLEELREVTDRIERVSRAEHDLIKEVHPAVSDIKERVEDVHGAVTSERNSGKK